MISPREQLEQEFGEPISIARIGAVQLAAERVIARKDAEIEIKDKKILLLSEKVGTSEQEIERLKERDRQLCDEHNEESHLFQKEIYQLRPHNDKRYRYNADNTMIVCPTFYDGCNCKPDHTQVEWNDLKANAEASEKEIERLTDLLSIMTENRDMWLRRCNEELARAEAAEQDVERLRGQRDLLASNAEGHIVQWQMMRERAKAAEQEIERLKDDLKVETDAATGMGETCARALDRADAAEQEIERLKETLESRETLTDRLLGDCMNLTNRAEAAEQERLRTEERIDKLVRFHGKTVGELVLRAESAEQEREKFKRMWEDACRIADGYEQERDMARMDAHSLRQGQANATENLRVMQQERDQLREEKKVADKLCIRRVAELTEERDLLLRWQANAIENLRQTQRERDHAIGREHVLTKTRDDFVQSNLSQHKALVELRQERNTLRWMLEDANAENSQLRSHSAAREG